MQTKSARKKNWFDGLPSPAQVERFHDSVAEAITVDRYGEWTVTELIDGSVDPGTAAKALDILIGYSRIDNRQTNDGIGFGLRVHLEVMSRQACYCGADGVPLHTFSIDPETPPEDGDIVRWQGRVKGSRGFLTSQETRAYRARGESEYNWHEFKVKDRHITVPFLQALDMLHSRGFRLEHTAGVQFVTIPADDDERDAAIRGQRRPRSRKISNWLYREAFDAPDGEPTQERKSARR